MYPAAAPTAYVWPGGGITVMVDVLDMPMGSFGYVPTPALVAPIEFTLRVSDYCTLGGHMDQIRPVESTKNRDFRTVRQNMRGHDPMSPGHYRWSKPEDS